MGAGCDPCPAPRVHPSSAFIRAGSPRRNGPPHRIAPQIFFAQRSVLAAGQRDAGQASRLRQGRLVEVHLDPGPAEPLQRPGGLNASLPRWTRPRRQIGPSANGRNA